ncbi:MAG: lamin tail domain-containing protein [Candidatus Syntrophosphaera sp.]|nr:lamin tail domain-containing protein [Candidatus Syntrophosphaera sp.]
MKAGGWRTCFWALALSILSGFPVLCAANVVINEVCYDPRGADTGHEWIELFNAGSADENLEGALILRGGSSFSLVFEIPHFILRPGRYILIGEAQVANAIFITPLAFQNGGAETDGIRYVSPDGLYTDTVLYDSPNTNGLPDDTGMAGTSFAPDVAEGWSLARRWDGLDTDDCEADFIAEPDPTPGLPNRTRADYALQDAQAWQDGSSWQFGVWVKNLDWTGPPVLAGLRFLLDGLQISEQEVIALTCGDSLRYVEQIPVTDGQNHLVEAILDLPDDPNPVNNHLSLALLGENLANPVFNEIMYDPATGNQEWIELWVADSEGRSDYRIRDAANNQFSFSLPASGGFFVLCSSAAQLLAGYPDCPASAAIEVSGWAPLNNDGDSLWIYDSEDACIDQMSYSGVSTQRNISLERQVNSVDEVFWRYSLDPSGATPGRANSQSAPVPDFSGTFNLVGSPFNAKAGESVSLFYQLENEQSRVNCRIFDRAGHRVRILADGLLIPSEGSLSWDGRDTEGHFASRGLYFILWESCPTSGGKTLRRQFSAAVYD